MSRVAFSFFLACVIGGLLAWWALGDVSFDACSAIFKELGWERLLMWGLVYVGLYAMCHGARIVRWYALVQVIDEKVDRASVDRVCVVGFAAIVLLPLRLGELVRPYLLSQRTHVSTSAALGTALVERVIDGLTMTGLLFLTLATYRGQGSMEFALTTATFGALIFVGALVLCVMALWRKEQTVCFVRRIFGPISLKLATALAELLDEFIDGFRGLVAAHALGRFMGLTALYWIANVGSMWVLARFGFGLDIGFWGMTTVLPLLVLGLMIPSGPAMTGNFELFMIKALGLFVVLDVAGKARVSAFSMFVHVLQLIVIVLPALIIMIRDVESRSLFALATASRDVAGAKNAQD